MAFYANAFGLRVGRRFGESFVEMLGAPAPIDLVAHPPGTTPSLQTADRRRYERHWTPVHLDFVVPELETALREARDAGAVPEGETREYAWGKLAVLSDPFGNGLCLIEFKGRGYGEPT